MKTIQMLFFITVVIVIYGCAPQTLEGLDSPSKIASPPLNPETTSGDFLTYENFDYGVKIGYPSDWEQKETEAVIIAFVPPKTNASDTFQENLGLTMNDLAGQGLTLQKYNEIVIEQLKQTFSDINIIESGSTVLSKNPAHRVVFTASNLKFMQVWTIKNDLAYVWSYAAAENSYSDYLNNIQKMLDSFEITRNIMAQAEDKVTEAKAEKETEEEKIGETAPIHLANSPFVGSWRVYSDRIFYGLGGAGALGIPITRNLELFKDGAWKFGDSKGTWAITEITSEDWSRWDINPYGPTRKIVLDKWNNAVADGPIEEDNSQIDFIWVIYSIEPPLVQNAGTVWLKFGP